MRKSANAIKGRKATTISLECAELEIEIACLMDNLSRLYRRTTSLVQTLRSGGGAKSAQTAAEVEVMLKHALRLLGDAMSQLPKTG